MLKIYDYLDAVLSTQGIEQSQHHQRLIYYASEVLERIGDTSETGLAEAIARTMQICSALDIAIDDNFKKIYRYNGQHLITDWQLSPLSCYLLLLNGNPMNPSVAKIQLYAAFHSK